MIILRYIPFVFEPSYIGYCFILMVIAALILLLFRR